MKAAKTLKISAALIAATALLVVAVLLRTCDEGDCKPANSWRLSTRVADLFGVDIAVETPDQANVLIIGVDSRKGSKEVHCDAIHLVSIDTVEDTVEFINVPRGTYSYIPKPADWEPDQELLDAVGYDLQKAAEEAEEQEEGEDMDGHPLTPPSQGVEELAVPEEPQEPPNITALAWSKEQYISNVCEYMGVEEFVTRIEKITGEEVDYQVMIGFSQAQGVLRALRFDPTTTLQFLRHRKTYGLGDVQRSYNQSLFLEDLLVNRVDMVDELPKTAQFALYRLVDTDLPYPVARGLLAWAQTSAVRSDTARITHRTAPSGTPAAQEIRFNEEEADAQVQALYDRLRVFDRGFSVNDVQPTLLAYVNQETTAAYNAFVAVDLETARAHLDGLIDQQIWHQIDDADERRDIMVRLAMLESSVTWFETQSEPHTLEFATSMIWNLELEERSEAWVKQIQEHLTELLRNRVSS